MIPLPTDKQEALEQAVMIAAARHVLGFAYDTDEQVLAGIAELREDFDIDPYETTLTATVWSAYEGYTIEAIMAIIDTKRDQLINLCELAIEIYAATEGDANA